MAMAINRDQLWLPRDYYRHLRTLYKAAEMAEDTERCKYVIAGTLSQERSDIDHPVFVITCRDQQRQTFAYIMDGISLEILNRPSPPDPEVAAQQALQQKLEKKWLACFEQIKRRTQGFRNTSLSQDMPAANVIDDNNVHFIVDFNATSRSGDALRYRARCEFNGNKKVVVINALLQAEMVDITTPDKPVEQQISSKVE